MAAIFSGCSTRGRAWAWGIRTAARSTGCHIRVNLALPLSRVREACDRLDRYVFGV